MSFTTLREGDKQIPVVARLRLEERAQLSDLQNLYVYASQDANKAPLLSIASLTATAVLRAGWWAECGDVYRTAASAGAVRDLRAGSQDCEMGNPR
jgi:hypothetical protein